MTKPVRVHVTATAQSASHQYLARVRSLMGAGTLVDHAPARYRVESTEDVTEYQPAATVAVLMAGRSIESWSADAEAILSEVAVRRLDRAVARQ